MALHSAAPIAEISTATVPVAAIEGNASVPVAVGQATAAAADDSDSAKVQIVATTWCYQCHSVHPTLMFPPARGVSLGIPEELGKHVQLAYQQAVQQKLMPLGDMT